MLTGLYAMKFFSLIVLLLVTSQVTGQRSRSRFSSLASSLSSLGSQPDMLSFASPSRGRDSFSSGNNLFGDLLGLRSRGQGSGSAYQRMDSPDAAYLQGSMTSRKDVANRRSGGSRGLSDFDRGLGLGSTDRFSSSGYNRYDMLGNAMKDSLNFELRNGMSSFGSRSGGSSSGFDLGGVNRGPGSSFDMGRGGSRGAGNAFDRLGDRPMSQFEFRNNRQPSNLGGQGFNFQQGPDNVVPVSSVMNRGMASGVQAGTRTFVRSPAVQQMVQRPTNTIVSVGTQPSSTSYSNIPTTNVVSAFVQPATNVVPVIQQTATSNLMPIVHPASVMVQQAPRMVPVVSVAAQPMQTVLQTLPQSPTLGYGGFRSFGNGLGRGLFSDMSPVIFKMESSHDLPSHSPMGQRRRGGQAGRNPNPNISVVKLDEGLSIMVNYSDPYGTIMNLPVPTNEEEASLLQKVLEKAEAPEYLKSMIRIRPRPNPVQAAFANGAAAAIPPFARPMPAAVPFAPAAPMVPAAVAAPVVPAAAAAAATVAMAAHAAVRPGLPNQMAPSGMYAAYNDMSIDEIIAGTMVPAAGMAAGGSSYPVDTRSADGRYILTALDMELTPQQYAELQSPTTVVGKRKKRKALTSGRSRWPGGVIPFEIQGMGFSPADNQQILNAMAQWSRSTCIQFRPATLGDVNKLVFREGKGCSSNVGMVGGPQYLTLQKECRIPKILAHEVGHALGLIHEHQRDDRDNFLHINYQNIKPGTQKDFDLFKMGSIDNTIAPYDYMSIMHYGKTAFARDKNMITMQAVEPKFTHVMGTATTLSPSDYNTVNVMYGCAGAGMGGMMAAPFPAPVPVAAAAAPAHTIMSRTPIMAGAPVQQPIVVAAPAQQASLMAPLVQGQGQGIVQVQAATGW